jgi:phage-related protein
MRKPRGRIRLRGTGYRVIVPAGLNPVTKRYRYQYEQVDTQTTEIYGTTMTGQHACRASQPGTEPAT